MPIGTFVAKLGFKSLVRSTLCRWDRIYLGVSLPDEIAIYLGDFVCLLVPAVVGRVSASRGFTSSASAQRFLASNQIVAGVQFGVSHMSIYSDEQLIYDRTPFYATVGCEVIVCLNRLGLRYSMTRVNLLSEHCDHDRQYRDQ